MVFLRRASLLEFILFWVFFCLFVLAVEINQYYLSSKERGGNEGNGRKSNKGSADDGGTEWQVEALYGGQDD